MQGLPLCRGLTGNPDSVFFHLQVETLRPAQTRSSTSDGKFSGGGSGVSGNLRKKRASSIEGASC